MVTDSSPFLSAWLCFLSADIKSDRLYCYPDLRNRHILGVVSKAR